MLDHGFVAAVRSGAIRIRPGVSRLDGDEVVHDDGSRSSPDAVIAGTGYRPGLDTVLGPLSLIDDHGLPTVGSRGGATRAPGLHTVGISITISGQLREIAKDAQRPRAVYPPLSRLVPSGGMASPLLETKLHVPQAAARSDCPSATERATEPGGGVGADPGVRSGRFRQDDAAGGVAGRCAADGRVRGVAFARPARQRSRAVLGVPDRRPADGEARDRCRCALPPRRRPNRRSKRCWHRCSTTSTA